MKIQNIQDEEKYSKNNNNSMFSEKLDSYFNTPIKSELEAIKKKSFLQKIKMSPFREKQRRAHHIIISLAYCLKIDPPELLEFKEKILQVSSEKTNTQR